MSSSRLEILNEGGESSLHRYNSDLEVFDMTPDDRMSCGHLICSLVPTLQLMDLLLYRKV
jgi:hypothetical protein